MFNVKIYTVYYIIDNMLFWLDAVSFEHKDYEFLEDQSNPYVTIILEEPASSNLTIRLYTYSSTDNATSKWYRNADITWLKAFVLGDHHYCNHLALMCFNRKCIQALCMMLMMQYKCECNI